jgi:phosphotransferase system enzyme I (PtsI)
MAERLLHGRPAAPGLAIGTLVRLLQATVDTGAHGPRQEEHARLDRAMAEAGAELEGLATADGELGAEILAFQVELLGDPSLIEPARAAIEQGAGAAAAWRAALEAQIQEYEAAEDDYFQARASDLRDLMERVLSHLSTPVAGAAALPAGAIVLDRDLTPSRFLAMDWARLGGVALEAGSPSSHVAMLARARGVPLLTGLGNVPAIAVEAVLDAETGILVLDPSAPTRRLYARRLSARREDDSRAASLLHEPALTATGERVELMLNVDRPDAVSDELLAASDGVGLMRTEFLFLGRLRLPDEEEQYRAFAALLGRLAGKPAIIRTLDIGGDKPLPGISLAHESNPFLGLRGLRLCLEHPELFRPQLRALLRAAHGRALKVMLPMVAVADELAEARAIIASCLAELTAEGVPAAMPPLGIMVETPAAAIAIDTLPADFYSIGSNDLVQYVLAASRDSGGRVAALADPRHPAVLRLIERVVRHGSETGLPVSLCGDMASDPDLVPVLLGLGLRRLSVAPAALARVKVAVRRFGVRDG